MQRGNHRREFLVILDGSNPSQLLAYRFGATGVERHAVHSQLVRVVIFWGYPSLRLVHGGGLVHYRAYLVETRIAEPVEDAVARILCLGGLFFIQPPLAN